MHFATSDNDLVVAVWDPTDTGNQPRGKQVLKPHGIFYTAVTGIWQTVWLEPVPSTTYRVAQNRAGLDRKRVIVTVEAEGNGTVRLEANDSETARVKLKTVAAQEDGKAGQPIELSLPDPKSVVARSTAFV